MLSLLPSTPLGRFCEGGLRKKKKTRRDFKEVGRRVIGKVALPKKGDWKKETKR